VKPAGHIGISAALGAGIAVTAGDPAALVTAVGAGVLIDADHTLDYYQWYGKGRREHVFYLLHGWEYGVLLVFVAFIFDWNPLLLAAALAYLAHIMADQIANNGYPLTYSLLYRAMHGFNMSRVSPWRVDGPPPRLRDLVPLGHVLAPRLSRLLGLRAAAKSDGAQS
jgi:hypothetical protein